MSCRSEWRNMIYSIHVCYSVSTNALASSCCTSLTVQSSHPNRTPVDMHMPISRPSLRMFFTLERKKSPPQMLPQNYRLLAPKVTRLQIPRHTRQLHNQAIQLLAHTHLTAQTRSLRQAKRQIQHVVLVIARLLHLVKHLLGRNHNMASRAGARPAACAFHFEII
jgi:hypothetical protein